MKKTLFFTAMLFSLVVIACSKENDDPIDTAKAKADEYISVLRTVNVSLSKLTFDGIYEKTMTSHEEYSDYWTSIVNDRNNQPVHPISDLDMSKTKFYRILSFLARLSLSSYNIEIGNKFYELHYKLSPNMQGRWRFIVLVSKDMQVVHDCANSYGITTKDCLQNEFNSTVGDID